MKGVVMKGLSKVFISAALLGAAPLARAAVEVTCDEAGFGGLPFILAPDPTAPGGPPVLTYILPFPVIPGDVLLFNPADVPVGGGQPQPQSDLVRFIATNPATGGGPTVLFYSDN